MGACDRRSAHLSRTFAYERGACGPLVRDAPLCASLLFHACDRIMIDMLMHVYTDDVLYDPEEAALPTMVV